MRHIIAIAFLLGMLAAGQVEAQVSCEGCTVEDMRNLASQKVTSVAFSDPHPPVYVLNIKDNIVVKANYAHNVDGSFDWENDLFEAWAIYSAVEPAVTKFVLDLHVILPGAGAVYATTTSNTVTESSARGMAIMATDADFPASVYDAIANPSTDGMIGAHIEAGSSGWKQGALNVIQTFNPIPGLNPNNAVISVKFHYSDGSIAIYVWSPITKSWERQKGTARDSSGNLVPETVADVAGGGYREYSFPAGSGTDFSYFANRLNQMGVPLGFGTGQTGSRIKVACSSAGGGAPACEVVIY